VGGGRIVFRVITSTISRKELKIKFDNVSMSHYRFSLKTAGNNDYAVMSHSTILQIINGEMIHCAVDNKDQITAVT